jgi:cell division protein FtsI (penicillin-binding protein 3)
LGLAVPDTTIEGRTRDMIQASRPDIVDRNGIVMAVDISVPSLFAEPRRISDVPDTVDKLRTVLPDLDRNWLLGRLSGNSGFVWIRRELTPALKERIMGLGLPGIDFINENRRFYPGGAEASHVIGTVDIDNRGTAGVELALDREYVEVLHDVGLARGQSLEPVELSIDMRVQHVMRQELVTAIARFRAIAGAGVMIEVRTGEVVALVSLPDFDPNVPASALEKDAINRITAGSYELGSTFKTVTIAAALDGGSLAIDDLVDAREGVRFGRFVLDHGKHRILSVPEIFRFSDNIGTIRIMQAMGKVAFCRVPVLTRVRP